MLLVIAGSNCETLDCKMGKDAAAAAGKVEDVEEGEISDSASVEEISEEDFTSKQEVVVVKESKPKDTRVWTMKDLYKYQIGRGYVNGLYNLAWAQAVQNKPLNELFVEVEPDENSKRSSPSSSVASSVNSSGKEEKKVDKVVIDDSGDEMDAKGVEKEEGELEEGEIDLDSEPLQRASGEVHKEEEVVYNGGLMNVDGGVSEMEPIEDVEKKVKLIREALENVTVVEVEKSFDAVCSKLQKTMENMREVVQHRSDPTKDALVQLLFNAVQLVNSVFSSMKHDIKEQNMNIFSRFLSFVSFRGQTLFSQMQIKEIEVLVSSLQSPNVLLSGSCGENEMETQVSVGENKKDNNTPPKSAGPELTTMNMLSSAAGYSFHNKPLEVPKPGVSFKSRVGLLPLLDLHKDHDADSLPSPTRETTTSLSAPRVMTSGDGTTKSGFSAAKTFLNSEGSKMHPYETDVLRAVSSYQQKFGRSSFFMSDRLPSPTPSEESGDGDGDTGGEVSSSSNDSNLRIVNARTTGQQIAASPVLNESSNPLGVVLARSAAPLSSVSSSTVKATAKSRDPRLRFINADIGTLDQNQRFLATVENTPKTEPVGAIMGSRKQKNVEDPMVNGPSSKRQKNSPENSVVVRNVKSMSGSGGWLEDVDIVDPQSMDKSQFAENGESVPQRLENGLNCPSAAIGQPNTSIASGDQPIKGNSNITGGKQAPLIGTGKTSLPDLLKDIAVNPTMLINILKMGQQQRLALEAQQKLADPAKNMTHPPSSILGAGPLVNVTPQQSSGILPRPAAALNLPSQMATTDESAKIRMKPRDPRRVLHNNTLHRTGSMSSEQLKVNATPTSTTQGMKEVQKPEIQEEKKALPSQSVLPPDISLPFTKSLKNIADIVSVSQPSSSASIGSQNIPSQPIQIRSDRVDVKHAPLSTNHHKGIGSAADVAVAGSRSQSTWGDVEHLFEGYDDQQKAAIHKERARRIEEQRKMFAARKLCLVLDLDHTLLNSAKFVEVDPVHDEILRKKEEQDREKPYRHLFRFPHMGMWTKLRPGIWNFLEKASKLYELHLYTMGNKLYATEMAKVLDPKGVLFNGRVISRGDEGDPIDGDDRGAPKSKDLEGVLGMESAVVIIDDSQRVWPHNKLNLIVVERYIYFPCSRRQFQLPGPSLLEIDHDERAEDGTLASSLEVIERIHQQFFAHHSLDEADVRNILASEQRKILAGCRIVFSRLVPLGDANPHLHPLWQMAEQFGAVCTTQIDEQVTHIVATTPGTDKVNWALSTGRFAVSPHWVEASALLYRRMNEADFAIKP